MSFSRLAFAVVAASAISSALWLSTKPSSNKSDAASPERAASNEEPGDRKAALSQGKRQPEQVEAIEAARTDPEQGIALLASYPIHDRWDLNSPVLPGRSLFAEEAANYQINLEKLTADEREAVVKLCESWNGLMLEERIIIQERRASVARSNIEAGIDCAPAGTTDADRIMAEAQGPDAVSVEVLVGKGIAFDGGSGRYVVILRRGFDSEAENAQARLDELYRASIQDLDALLLSYDAKL